MKYKKYIKFYILKPVFDHLHYKLSLVEPDFDYDLDVFYSILNDLSEVKYPKKNRNDNGYLPLYSKLLQQKYGNLYNRYMRYLGNHSIICSSLYYTKGMCTYYKINDLDIHIQGIGKVAYTYSLINTDRYRVITLDSKGIENNQNMVKLLVVVEIKIDVKSRVGKMITEYHNRELDRIKHYAKHIRLMKQYMKDTLELDVDSAKKFTVEKLSDDIELANANSELITEVQNAYSQRVRSILQIGDKSTPRKLRFSRNNTNRRLDTDLTNMAADLRPFIIGYDQMSYLDLSNSQPVLFNIMLKKLKSTANPQLLKEIELYERLTLSGGWYEYLIKIYNINTGDGKKDRDEAKGIWMEVAYSKNKVSKKTKKILRVGSKKIFGEKLPEISTVIENQKVKNHANFSIELQKIESKIFIDQICKELVAANIIPYSLHDGLLVPKQREEETYNIMARVLEAELGRIPVIAVNGEKRYPKKTLKNKNMKDYKQTMEYAKNARAKSRGKIYAALNMWDFTKDGEVTFEKLAAKIEMRKKTLMKYMGEFKDTIDSDNKSYQQRKTEQEELETRLRKEVKDAYASKVKEWEAEREMEKKKKSNETDDE